MKDGIFYEQRNISTQVIAEIFRACPCGSKQGARLLTVTETSSAQDYWSKG